MKSLKNLSASPVREFRPWAIWIWNHQIRREELEFQLNAIIEKGFGGVAIRPGREMSPAYMSAEFLEFFGRALAIAKEKGISVRLADDFSAPWNEVLKDGAEKNRAFRACRLVVDHTELVTGKGIFERAVANPENYMVLVSRLKKDRIDLQGVKSLNIPSIYTNGMLQWKPPLGEWSVLVLRKEYVRNFSGSYVLNPYNPEVADAYIKNYLEPLKARFSKMVTTTFEGFVTEMPTLIPGGNSIPWDDTLPVRYRAKFKKELVELLPALFFDVEPQNAKHRAHIYNFLLQSMYECLADPLEKWGRKMHFSQWLLCAERDMTSISHMLSDFFAIPEGNYLWVGVQNHEGTERNRSILRAVADTNANQYRRGTLNVLGRNRLCNAATIQQLKNEIDQLAFSGPSITIIDGLYANLDHRTHLKTPFNPFWYSSDWEYMGELCAYAGRMQQVAADLTSSRDIAVLLPTESALAEYLPSSSIVVDQAQERLRATIDELGKLNLSYDLVNEETVLSCSVRSNGEFGTADRIRKGNYRALVIPYARLISKGILVFVEKLAVKKAMVIFVGEAPQGCLDDGMSPAFVARIAKLTGARNATVREIPAADLKCLAQVAPPAAHTVAQGIECTNIAAVHLSGSTCETYWLRNISDTEEYFASIDLPGHKFFFSIDCGSGSIHELTEVEANEGISRLTLSFLPRQTHLVVGTSIKIPTTPIVKEKRQLVNLHGGIPRNYRVVLRNQWKFVPLTLNVLPLSSWSTRIGLSRELGNYSHYWETFFEVKDIPPVCHLVFDTFSGLFDGQTGIDKSCEITVNGNPVVNFRRGQLSAKVPEPVVVLPPAISDEPQPLPPVSSAPFLRNRLMCDMHEFLAKGYNRVAVRSVGVAGDPPVIVYPPLIAGNFPVEKGARGWAITSGMPSVSNDSWAKYGFPYLSGAGVYSQVFEVPSEYERLVLSFSQVSGPIEVSINGVKLAAMSWQPLELDVTKACTSKRNELSVRLVNTVDNVLRMNGRSSGIVGDVYLDVY